MKECIDMYNSHHLLVYTVFQIPMYVGSPMPSIKVPTPLIEGPSIASTVWYLMYAAKGLYTDACCFNGHTHLKAL